MKKFLLLFFSFVFMTHLSSDAIAWNAPETISSAMVDASEPQIVMDADGNVTAVWVESTLVKASNLPVGGSWSSPETLSGANSSSPRLAIDSSGNVIAVWVDSGFVNTATMSSAGTWGSVTVLSGSGASAPVVAVNSDGDAVVVWVRNGFIESKTKTFLGLWSLVSVLSASGSDHPDVAVGGNDNVVAVWHTNSGASHVLYSSSQILNGVWGTPKPMISVSPEFKHDYAKVAVDQNGNAIALWFRFQEDNGNFINLAVLSSTLPYGGNAWSPIPTALNFDGALALRNPADLVNRIHFDSSGNALAFWSISYDNSKFTYESAFKPKGGLWSPTTQVFDPDLYAFSGSSAVTSSGASVAAFTFFDSTNLIIQATESNISGIDSQVNWQTRVEVSQGGSNAFPQVAAQEVGTEVLAAAAWLSWDGVTTSLQTATGSRTLVEPPTSLSVTQNSEDFGVFTDYYNTITWTDSVHMDVVEYVVFRNGVLFARVAPGIGEAVEHNTIQNGPVVYGVLALDSNLSASQIATVNYP